MTWFFAKRQTPITRKATFRPRVEELESRTMLTLDDINLGTLTGFQMVHDEVSFADFTDVRTFTFAAPGTFTASLVIDSSLLIRDCELFVVRNEGNGLPLVASSDNPGSNSEFFSISLSPGTYNVDVRLKDSFTGLDPGTGYSLVLVADYAGQTLGTARDLGSQLVGTRSFDDFVSNLTSLPGLNDNDDFYSFSIPTTSTISATLTGLTADADLRLIRDVNNNGVVDTGDLLARSINTGIVSESISHGPNPAGTYFLRVNSAGAGFNANYHLSLTVTPLDGAGNTLNTAHVVPASRQAAQQFNDFVGNIDRDDFYQVFLAGPGPFNFSATLNGLTADANVELIRDTNSNGVIDSGEMQATSTNTGTNPENIGITLNAVGTYFVRVRRGSGDTAYTLTLSAVSTDTAGNTLTAARNIGTLNGRQTFTQFVGAVDTDDFYKFNFAARGTFTAFLSGPGGNADFDLIRAGTPRTPATVVTTAHLGATISRTLTPDDYFIRVKGIGDTNYTLTLTADYAGGDVSHARSVAPGIYGDFVGSTDTNDFYQITLTGDSTLTATVSGLSANADLQLININYIGRFRAGDVVAASANLGTSVETASRDLEAGVYAVRVFPIAGETNYSLRLTVTPVSASIAGLVFDDLNGDFHFNAGEPLLSNVTLFLDGNQNGTRDTGEMTAVTINGAYRFGNLTSGTYFPKQETPPGFLGPGGSSATIGLRAGSNLSSLEFPDVRPASVSGSVFNDRNGNSIRDANDTPLSNWTIFVDTNRSLVLDPDEVNVLTDSLGNYAFTNVRPGTVFQVLQPGFTQTLPLPSGTYTLGSGQNLAAQNFGVSRLIVDNVDATQTGRWDPSTQVSGFFGVDYLKDNNSDKGTKSVRFVANIPVTGSYQVFARWTAANNRANNTPIDIVHRDGTATVLVNQRRNGGVFFALGTPLFFNAGPNGIVVIRNGGTTDLVIADAIQFVRMPPVAPSNLVATALPGSQVLLTWADNSLSEAGFKIQRSTHPSFNRFEEIALFTLNTTSFTDTVEAHRMYYYRVLAYGVSGESSFSNTVRVRTPAGHVSAAGVLPGTPFDEDRNEDDHD